MADVDAKTRPRPSGYALRMPADLKAEAEEAARLEGASLNQLINLALAEKLATLRTTRRMRALLARADRETAMRVLTRESHLPLPEGDELPDGFGTDE